MENKIKNLRQRKGVLRCILRIRGRVQGVFFRAFVKQRAEELGVLGWVRNEQDGSVTVAAEGEGEQLRTLVQCCKEGPPGAEVSSVAEEWGEASGNHYEGFQIR